MYIRMEGLKFYAFHGVLPQENLVGAYYHVDLKLKTDFTHAAETDELEDTVSYADIFTVVKKRWLFPLNFWNTYVNALPPAFSTISKLSKQLISDYTRRIHLWELVPEILA